MSDVLSWLGGAAVWLHEEDLLVPMIVLGLFFGPVVLTHLWERWRDPDCAATLGAWSKADPKWSWKDPDEL